jgi:NAD(P)-dependent dehydrogenase (short-subunit alcohol dehydrogenase family)
VGSGLGVETARALAAAGSEVILAVRKPGPRGTDQGAYPAPQFAASGAGWAEVPLSTKGAALLGLLISGWHEHADEPAIDADDTLIDAQTQAFDAPTQAISNRPPPGRHRPR